MQVGAITLQHLHRIGPNKAPMPISDGPKYEPFHHTLPNMFIVLISGLIISHHIRDKEANSFIISSKDLPKPNLVVTSLRPQFLGVNIALQASISLGLVMF